MNTPQTRARLIAHYLPQFHPIPENDAWWGPGFTEWTNVAKARPLFDGHQQPRLPAHLGFYDLRLPESRQAQADLAARHGVEAFCYWHYWFAGRRLLHRPFEEVLASGSPSLPFCLGWANESWTGIWHGSPQRMLIEQTYPGEDDDRRHFDCLLPAFADPRYLRVDDKPLLVIYKPLKMPEPQRRFELWRRLAERAGLAGLHIVGINLLDFDHPQQLGLDGVIVSNLASLAQTRVAAQMKRLYWGVRRRMPLGSLRVMPYAEAQAQLLPDLDRFGVPAYPCVVPNWDNTPRSGQRGFVLTGSSPAAFQEHLQRAIERVAQRPWQQRLVFLKSWNEWAEGNYVEPDAEHGLGWLEAIRHVNVVR